MLYDVAADALDWFDGVEGKEHVQEPGEQWTKDAHAQRGEVVGVWMTSDDSVEEARDERAVRKMVERRGQEFRLFRDEKYYVDDRDQPFEKITDLPDVYTSYRKSVEPLRERPRPILPTPKSLPPFPPLSSRPPQSSPLKVPEPLTLEKLMTAVLAPLEADPGLTLSRPPKWPKTNVSSAHPFTGGESHAKERVWHLLASSAMSNYKDTRNGLLGRDFSTKLSAYLALGCLSARWVHWEMLAFEDGSDDTIMRISLSHWPGVPQHDLDFNPDEALRAPYRSRWKS
ncbi:hypothetical protein LTS18_002295, partial [Coniosporium uncinatum]